MASSAPCVLVLGLESRDVSVWSSLWALLGLFVFHKSRARSCMELTARVDSCFVLLVGFLLRSFLIVVRATLNLTDDD